MTEQGEHIFPLIKLQMVIASVAPDSWWAGYQAGRLNQRDADEKALNLDREKIADILDLKPSEYVKELAPWLAENKELIHRIHLSEADQIIKLIRGE